MSKKFLYNIKDEALGYVSTFQMDNDAIAIRVFTQNCNNPKNPENQYPDQFSLWRLGTIDDETGIIENKVEKILGAEQCIVKSEKNTLPA